jgi:hypothetical protein
MITVVVTDEYYLIKGNMGFKLWPFASMIPHISESDLLSYQTTNINQSVSDHLTLKKYQLKVAGNTNKKKRKIPYSFFQG